MRGLNNDKMAFDKQTRKDIEGILSGHLGKDSIIRIDDSTADLSIEISDLIRYTNKKICGNAVLGSEAESYYRNLAEACSALLTLCKDRNLNVLYIPEKYKFIITDINF